MNVTTNKHFEAFNPRVNILYYLHHAKQTEKQSCSVNSIHLMAIIIDKYNRIERLMHLDSGSIWTTTLLN